MSELLTQPSTERAWHWAGAANILCVRLDNMGDVLMTTPAMRALKHMPRRHGTGRRRLTLLASRAGADIAAHVPEVDETLVYEAPWMKAARAHAAGTDRKFSLRLAQRSFDAAVIFTCYSQSALPGAMLCTYAGIPLKLAHCRENPYALLSDWIQETEPERGVRHEVQRQLDLVAAVGARTEGQRLSLRVRPADRIALSDKLNRLGLGELAASSRYIVIHPGASAPSRRYTPERFAAAARDLSRVLGAPLVVTGGHSERSLADGIVRASEACAASVAGELSIGELAALIAGAGLLISNNTGPVHMASALGTPVVDLYALTNPQHGPWQVPHRILNRDVPCRYCYKSICPHGHGACLDVPSREVVQAAAALWHTHVDVTEHDRSEAMRSC